MNNNLSKEIKYNLDTNKLYNDDNLNKSIIVEVDRSFIDKQNNISNGIIEIGLNDFYIIALERLRNISNYLKRVKLDKPNKQNIMGRILELPLEVDLLSSTTALYEELKWVPFTHMYIKKLIEKTEELQEEYQGMINENIFNNVNAINKVTLLAQLEGLKNIRLSLLQLDNSYNLVSSYPDIRRYMFYWTNYKKDGHFPQKCIFNDEAYKFIDDLDELNIGKTNVIKEYNDMNRALRRVRKLSKTYHSFFLYISMTYGFLMRSYKQRISDCLKSINNYHNKLNDNKLSDENKSKIIGLKLMKQEFIKLEEEIDILAADKRIYDMGVKAGSFILEGVYPDSKKTK